MIVFDCEHCGRSVRFKEEHAGKKARCPACANSIMVPMPDTDDSGDDAEESLEVSEAVEETPPPQPKKRPQPVDRLHDEYCVGCGKILRNVLVCPACHRKLCSEVCVRRHKDHCKPNSSCVVAVLALVAIGLLGWLFFGQPDEHKDGGRQEIQATRLPRNGHAVDASSLTSSYRVNAIDADNRYKDKWLKVTGQIDEIGNDLLGSPYIIMRGNDIAFFQVQCVFDTSHQNSLSSLLKGETVTVSGICKGKTLNILIENCSLESR